LKSEPPPSELVEKGLAASEAIVIAHFRVSGCPRHIPAFLQSYWGRAALARDPQKHGADRGQWDILRAIRKSGADGSEPLSLAPPRVNRID
jgi:hypothetical protein